MILLPCGCCVCNTVHSRWSYSVTKQCFVLSITVDTVDVRERTIIGSDQNRYWAYHIESYRLLLYRPMQVQHLLTVALHRMIKGWSRPAICRARMPLIDHDTGGGSRAGVQMLTATLQPLIRPTCHTPALQPTHQATEQTAAPGG